MRVFLAIDLPEELRASIHDVSMGMPGAFATVPASNLHITLHFLGDITDKKVYEVEGMMDSVRVKRFDATVKGISFFGGSSIQTVFAKVLDKGMSAKLHTPLATGLEAMGIATDQREYLPHITVARMKHPLPETKNFILKNSNLDFGSFVADRFSLKKSVLSEKGASYEILYERELS